MTKRIAMLDSESKVFNIAVYPNEFVPDGVTTVMATQTVQVGDTWRGGRFVPGPPKPLRPEDPIVLSLYMLAEIMGGDAPVRLEALLRRRGE